MKQVNLYEAKTRLSSLVEEAAAGEEIVIAKNGKPMAKLTPIDQPVQKTMPRKLGLWDEQNKHIDWDKWDRDFKAADKEIDRMFFESDVPSALDDMAPKPKKRKVEGFAEKRSKYRSQRKRRPRA